MNRNMSLSIFPMCVCTRCFQVKVMTDHELLSLACEQFLGKSVSEIKGVILQTLEGHLRSILGMSALFTSCVYSLVNIIVICSHSISLHTVYHSDILRPALAQTFM